MNGGQPPLVVLADANEVAAQAADLVLAALDRCLQATGRADLALTQGPATATMCEHLTAARPDWSGVHLWVGAERCVPHEDAGSTVRWIRQRLPAPGAVLHAPPPTGAAEKRALAYSFQLKQRVLDIVVLQLGDDGSIAGLTPHDPALSDPATIVAAGTAGGQAGVSLGLSVLSSATQRLVLVTGGGGSAALGPVLGAAQPGIPASLLPAAGTVVLADRAARGTGPAPLSAA